MDPVIVLFFLSSAGLGWFAHGFVVATRYKAEYAKLLHEFHTGLCAACQKWVGGDRKDCPSCNQGGAP